MARGGDGGSSGRDDGRDGGDLAQVVPLVPHPVRPTGFRLPTFATPLVGRGPEVDQLAQRLGPARLLTVTGPGGIGKTRLAVEVARRIAPESARFVDLAPLRDERLVAGQVASAFGVRDVWGRELAPLVAAAAPAGTVLLLDNCEHVVAACAGVARELVLGCPNVRVLATSQQPVGVPGEVLWPVPPLELPDPADRDPEAATHSPAVQLFCARAAAARPGFAPGPGELEAIVEVCRRLDANPLAIELAAARVRTLSPAEIAARLQRRFQLLRARPGASESRHHSLAAALGWSYELLGGPEKRCCAGWRSSPARSASTRWRRSAPGARSTPRTWSSSSRR